MESLRGWHPSTPLAIELDRFSDSGLVVLDEYGTIMLVNDAAVRWLAPLLPDPFRPDALPGRSWRELVVGSPLPAGIGDLPCPGSGDAVEVPVPTGPGWRVERRPLEDHLTLLRVSRQGDDPMVRRQLDAFLGGYPLGGLAFFDADMRHLAMGGRVFSELGGSQVGATPSELWPPETARTLEPLYEAALEGVSQTASITLADRTHLCWISPVAGDGKDVQGLIFTCDVTEPSTLGRRYQRIFEAVPMPLMVHAEDGEVLTVNGAWCARSGYGRSETSTVEEWVDRAAPEDPAGMREAFRRPFTDAEGPDPRIVELRTRSGDRLLWELASATLPEEPGGRRLCVSMAHDVTASEGRRRKLDAPDRTLRVTTAAMRALLRSPTEETLLERVRDALVDTAGYAGAGVWLVDERRRPGPAETHRVYRGEGDDERDRQARAAQAAVEVELPHIAPLEESPGGRALAAYPLVSGGNVPGALLVVAPRSVHDDPSERRLLIELATDLGHGILARRTEVREGELARRLKRTERLEALGQLTSGVAHDVNNTLSIILGQTEVLQATPQLPEGMAEDLEQIRRAALKSAQITAQLLSFARERDEEERVVDLQEALASCHALLAFLVGEHHNLRLETPGEEGIHVSTHGSQLEQVVINLVVNARDASPKGGPIEIAAGRVRLEGEAAGRVGLEPGAWACIEVRDEGAGMDARTVRHIFEPFFTTKESGTGLGLATVREIARARGGAVGLETAPGRGATFRVYLPLAPAPPDPEPEVATGDDRRPFHAAPNAEAGTGTGGRGEADGGRRTSEGPEPVDPATGASSPPTPAEGADPARPSREEPDRRILLVEDDRIVQDVFRQILQHAGHRVVAVGTGREALEALGDAPHGFSLVISDVVLPDTTGKLLAERIEELAPDLPIAFTSGYDLEDLRLRHGFGEVRYFLKKPFTSRDILGLVERVLGEGAG